MCCISLCKNYLETRLSVELLWKSKLIKRKLNGVLDGRQNVVFVSKHLQ